MSDFKCDPDVGGGGGGGLFSKIYSSRLELQFCAMRNLESECSFHRRNHYHYLVCLKT